MPKVIDRIQHYEQMNPKFKFTQVGKLNVGMDIKRAWISENHDITLLYEWSQEPEGTFHVLNYPDFFTDKIDEIIYYYVVKITTHEKYKKKKKTSEKPLAKQLSKTNVSVPPDPQIKKRKRKPIPAYTTRKK